MWGQKTDRCRRALENENDDNNKEDKVQTEAADKGDGETTMSIAIAGSLYFPLSNIWLPLHLGRLCLEAEARELSVSAPESASEDKVEM